MRPSFVGAVVGLAAAGPIGALLGGVLPWGYRTLRSSRKGGPPRRLFLILLLVEVRSGMSVLASLHGVAGMMKDHPEVERIARVASVSGLSEAISHAGPELRPILAQLARSQRSGASLSDSLRGLLERDLAAERARRLARARSLPVRIMIPVTLLMLPGLVLLLYAPALVGLLTDLTGTWP